LTFCRRHGRRSSGFRGEGAVGRFQTFHNNIPHGSVAKIDYWSEPLGIVRRMHVYTPPGYEKNAASYPVLYL
jgi:enterochelin esterase-like enzyme